MNEEGKTLTLLCIGETDQASYVTNPLKAGSPDLPFIIHRERSIRNVGIWILYRPECNHSVGNTRVPHAGSQTDDIDESLSVFHQKSSQ